MIKNYAIYLCLLLGVLYGCGTTENNVKQEKVSLETPEIIFVDTTFEAVLAMSKKQHKPIMMDVYAKWCKPCKELEKTVFKNTTVATYYNQHFINYRLDVGIGNNKTIAQKYGVRNYPTLVFLDASGESLLSSIGLIGPDMMLDFGKDVLGDWKEHE